MTSQNRPERSAQELFDAAFTRPRDPRSAAYKAGVLYALRSRLDGHRAQEPFGRGTAESDAYFSGCREGHRLADAEITEQGRQLASQRDDLVASGVDPGELEVPLDPARLPHADVPGLTPETCPERDSHGKPFRWCPVKGCGWHDGMPS